MLESYMQFWCSFDAVLLANGTGKYNVQTLLHSAEALAQNAALKTAPKAAPKTLCVFPA